MPLLITDYILKDYIQIRHKEQLFKRKERKNETFLKKILKKDSED